MPKDSAPDKADKSSNKTRRIWIPLVVIAAVLLIAYLSVAFYYRSHFFPGTRCNGVSIGNKSLSGAETSVSNVISSYSLTITGTDGSSDILLGTDIALSMPDDGMLEEMLASQNAFLWFLNMSGNSQEDELYSSSYNSALLEEAIRALSLFDETLITYSEDAHLTYSSEEKAYVVAEEVYGTELIYENVEAKIIEAVNSLAVTLTLDAEDYVQPTVFQDDESLIADAEKLNQYVSTTITYTTEGAEVLDGDTISGWVSLDESGEVVLDETAIASYVQSLAYKYNTYADERSFLTSLGDTITIGGGDYGWVIDKSGEAAQIIADLESGETEIERAYVFEQTAFVDSFEDDIGTTYIELDYTNQHMYYYVDGVLTLESDFVSGKLSNGNGSPDGVFKIVYKERDATLVGEDYSSAVSYFMPFAYNVGLHDASWRSSFGGTIYKTSGSHGCINLPSDIAEELYNLVEVGTPVVAYYRESVSLTSTSSAKSNAYSYVGD